MLVKESFKNIIRSRVIGFVWGYLLIDLKGHIVPIKLYRLR